MKEVADAAVAQVPSVHTVLVVRHAPAVTDAPMRDGRDVDLDTLPDATFEPLAVDSEHPLFIAYTSGTTGRPKGAVHVHGGFTVKIAEEVAFQTDLRPGERLFWLTDIGWIMGPVGDRRHAREPRHARSLRRRPRPSRSRPVVVARRAAPHQRPRCVAHAHPRARWRTATNRCARHDLSSLRILASTGEPWNEAPWRWYFDVVGERRCPIINISGGTEVGACFLSPARRAAALALFARRSCARHGGRRLRRRWPLGARRGRRARVHEAVARHDAWPVPRSAALSRRRTGRATRTCGGTATSRASATTANGSCTAAPTTRSSSRASDWVRPRSRPRVVAHPAVRRSRGDRRARRAEGRGALGVRRPGARTSSRRRARGPRSCERVVDGARSVVQARASALHARAAEDAQRQGAAPRDSGGRHGRPIPAICRASRIAASLDAIAERPSR